MRQKIVICIVAAVCLLLQSCAQKSSSQFEIIRLIDELEAENIIMSPLLKLSEIDLSSNQSFPIKSFPLQDMGSKVENIVSLVDVVPTILDEMGINSSRYELDGKSLIPILEGKDKKDRTFLSDVGENILNMHLPQKIATNEGKTKLILNKTIRSENKGFFRFPPPSPKAVELFDLSSDPFEYSNIVDKKSSLANRILDRIEEIYKRAKRKKSGQAILDEELKKQLRALGYIK